VENVNENFIRKEILFLLFFSSVLNVSRLVNGGIVEVFTDLSCPPDLAHLFLGWKKLIKD
jgi:hypothetical protein